MLIIVGDKDHRVPPAIAKASYRKRNLKTPGRGHAVTNDQGCREVNATALIFVQRFATSA